MQTGLSLTEHVLIFKCLSIPPGSRTSCLFELRPACARAANQIEMSQGRTSEWRPQTNKINRLLNDKPKWLWAPCCWGPGLVHHTVKSSLGSARKPWRCLSKSTAAADHCWESPAVRLGECEAWGLLWYWFVGLEETSWRNFSRNGFRTSEQRWNAVRMYSSLHPLWQLSLHVNTREQIRDGPAVITLGWKSVGDLRFGAGVGCYLLYQLAVGFILNQPMFAT